MCRSVTASGLATAWVWVSGWATAETGAQVRILPGAPGLTCEYSLVTSPSTRAIVGFVYLSWTELNPRQPSPRIRVRWNLADPIRRRDLYEIVLVEGTLDDVRELINGTELVRLWDQLYLPPWVRSAWRPLIDSAGTAA